MADLTENSETWGLVKVTIGSPAAAISPASQLCRSAKMYHYSGTATFVARASAAATDWPLPITSGTAEIIPVRNLNELSFFGTAGDVVLIMWRA